MIIKSLSRKTASFGQLIDYINKPQQKASEPIFHNLQAVSDNPGALEKEFLENRRYCPVRKNGVLLFHEILSFAEKDREFLTEDILNDLVRQYLQMRAPGALAYGKAHFDTACPHIHILISGNLIRSPRKLRLTRREFDRVRRGLERYQRREYPFLAHSLVFDRQSAVKEKIGFRGTRKEAERSRRLKEQGKEGQSRKERVSEVVRDSLLLFSQAEFRKGLRFEGLEFYVRGNSPGVEDVRRKRKYRLKTLGLYREYQEAEKRWQKASERVKGLGNIQIEKGRLLWGELAFREDVMDVLEDDGRVGGRRKDLKSLLRLKREREREAWMRSRCR